MKKLCQSSTYNTRFRAMARNTLRKVYSIYGHTMHVRPSPETGRGGGLLSSTVWLLPFTIISLPADDESLFAFFLSRGFCTSAYSSSTLFCCGKRPATQVEEREEVDE